MLLDLSLSIMSRLHARSSSDVDSRTAELVRGEMAILSDGLKDKIRFVNFLLAVFSSRMNLIVNIFL